MAHLPWIKLYTELIEDPQLSRLSEAQKWRFVQILLVAGDCDAEGYLVTSLEPMTLEDIAWKLRLEPATLQVDLEALSRRRLVIFDRDAGAWFVPSFARRQDRPNADKRAHWRDQKRRQRARQSSLFTGDDSLSSVDGDDQDESSLYSSEDPLESYDPLDPDDPQASSGDGDAWDDEVAEQGNAYPKLSRRPPSRDSFETSPGSPDRLFRNVPPHVLRVVQEGVRDTVLANSALKRRIEKENRGHKRRERERGEVQERGEPDPPTSRWWGVDSKNYIHGADP